MSKEYENYEEDYEEEEELDEEELINEEIKNLCREMKKCDRTSEKYMVLCQRLSDLTDAKRNIDESARERTQAEQIENQKYAWILPTVCQTLGNITGQIAGQMLNRRTVNDVLYYEKDGNIVTTKATGFMQKPRN